MPPRFAQALNPKAYLYEGFQREFCLLSQPAPISLLTLLAAATSSTAPVPAIAPTPITPSMVNYSDTAAAGWVDPALALQGWLFASLHQKP